MRNLDRRALAAVDTFETADHGLKAGTARRSTPGPNGSSRFAALFAAFFDSTNLDRVTMAGDIVRVDLGCDSGMSLALLPRLPCTALE